MPIDFFTQGQKGTSEKELLGICDDTIERNKKPAYIDESNQNKWIAEVHNRNKKSIDFYAIDCCITWYLENGDFANACDGMLAYNENQNIIFVELKNRNPENKQWRIKAEKQLKSTIECFQNNHDTDGVLIKAYVCNKQALFDEGVEEYLEKFKDDTGVTLRVFREIEIQWMNNSNKPCPNTPM